MSSNVPHSRCGWIEPEPNNNIMPDPYRGRTSFLKLAPTGFFRVIHPGWYDLDFTQDSLPPKGVGDVDDAQICAAALAHNVAVWPLVNPSLNEPDQVRMMQAILKDPMARDKHAQQLVDLTVVGRAALGGQGYVGLDIDYEHLGGLPEGQGGLPDSLLRQHFNEFIARLAELMHAANKELSVAPGGVPDPERDVGYYDYDALSLAADVVHVQAYDLHRGDPGHPGPACPTWWLESLMAHADRTAAQDPTRRKKYVFGMPNFAYVPDGSGTPITLREAPGDCQGSTDRTDSEAAQCPLRIQGNPASPEIPLDPHPGPQPHCQASNGVPLYYDDVDSLRERVCRVKARGFGGITYWHLGDEPDGFSQMILDYFGDNPTGSLCGNQQPGPVT